MHRGDALTMLNGSRAKMRALQPNGPKMAQKIVHGDKIGRPMSQKKQVDGIIALWWRGRVKVRTGQENADSFTMQMHTRKATAGQKEPAQTLLILDIFFAQY